MDALDDSMIATLDTLETRRLEIDEAIMALKKVMARDNPDFAKDITKDIPWANPGPRRVAFYCGSCAREVYAPVKTKTCPACGVKNNMHRQKTKESQ